MDLYSRDVNHVPLPNGPLLLLSIRSMHPLAFPSVALNHPETLRQKQHENYDFPSSIPLTFIQNMNEAHFVLLLSLGFCLIISQEKMSLIQSRRMKWTEWAFLTETKTVCKHNDSNMKLCVIVHWNSTQWE